MTSAASEAACAITFRTPGGRPAWRKISPIAHEHFGENSGALRIHVFPAAIAYVTDRKPRMYAAFLRLWLASCPILAANASLD